MKFNKYKAFTLAELMVLLSVLTVLLAAFAPVFTVRYNNASADNVWSFVTSDDNFDAYTDPVNKLLTAQSFIGLTPSGKTDVANLLTYNSNTLYSKLVLRASDRLSSGEKQKQIRFLYGNANKKGTDVGTLFAGEGNLLLGGAYEKINTGKYNTAYGSDALTSITTGSYNTAIGYNAGKKITSSNYNTVIGYNAGSALTSGTGNTLIGFEAAPKLATGKYNTVVGNHSGFTSSSANYNTLVGDYIGEKGDAGEGNTAVGSYALSGTQVGSYNTAVGAYALSSFHDNAGYNTGIGYSACSAMTGFNKTCIGSKVGSYGPGVNVDASQDFLFTDREERVYIGSAPIAESTVSQAQRFGGISILEVHNVGATGGTPSAMGNASVLINGNLIVRGQPFFMGNSPIHEGRALMGFYLDQPKDHGTGHRALMGFDGTNKTHKVQGRHNVRHAKTGARENCVCARRCGSATVPKAGSTNGIKSYDWATRASGNGDPNEDGGIKWYWRGDYTDASTGESCKTNTTDHENEYIDFNRAHVSDDGSCCPDLRSDIRLKDLTGIFTDGLDSLKKIKVYNFTYKADENKDPHVGVIAQDLKQVFPTAVSKDDNGYYQIRWDEMLYAAINAIKEINSKVVSLAERVTKDSARIAALKKDNSNLEKQVDNLAKELAVLESKSK